MRKKGLRVKLLAGLLTVILLVAALPLLPVSADVQVNFSDPQLEAVVRDKLGIPEGRPVTQDKLGTLTELDCMGKEIRSLSGLEYATQLTWLNLSENKLDNAGAAALEKLESLTRLDLSHNQLSTLSMLRPLAKLEVLDASDNQLTSAQGLEELSALKTVILRNNFIYDETTLPVLLNDGGTQVELAPQKARAGDAMVTFSDPVLAAAVRKELGLSSSAQISEKQLASLKSLSCTDSALASLAGLEKAVNLEYLQVARNRLTDLTPILGLASLGILDVRYNYLSAAALSGANKLAQSGVEVYSSPQRKVVTDTAEVSVPDSVLAAAIRKQLGLQSAEAITRSALSRLIFLDVPQGAASLKGLEYAVNLERLSIGKGSISDLSPLTELTSLVSLDLSGNRVQNLSPLSKLANLRILNLSQNEISSLTPLKTLNLLHTILLPYNRLDLSTASAATATINGWREQGTKVWYLPQNGMVSPQNPTAVVNISDSALRQAVCEQLRMASGSVLTEADLARLTYLKAPGQKIASLGGLEKAVNLSVLDLYGNNLQDISQLKGLPLAYLDVQSNYLPTGGDTAAYSDLLSIKAAGCNVLYAGQRTGTPPVGDSTAPGVTSVTLNVNSVSPGESIRVSAILTDSGSGPRSARMEWLNRTTGETVLLLLPVNASGQVVGNLSITALNSTGVYTLCSMLIIDSAGNSFAASPQNCNFTVSVNSTPKLETAPGSPVVLDRSSGYMTGVPIGTPVSRLSSLIKTSGLNGYSVQVVKSNGAVASAGNFGTGMKVRMVNKSTGKTTEEFTIAVYGDIDGDGIVNISDLVGIRLYMFGKQELAGVYFEAGNVTAKIDKNPADRVINIADLVAVRLHMFGKQEIPQ